MIDPQTNTVKPPKIEFATTTGWSIGTISRLDDDRTPTRAVSVTENVQLNQNGTIKPRPGLREYGVQPGSTVLGQLYEYVKYSGTTPETWLIWGEDDGKIYTAKDGATPTEVTGATYDTTAKLHFEQIANNVVITNGCLTGDSMVLTSKGEKRIDTVKVGDMVWTPAGYSKVEWAGATKKATKLIKITTEKGVLECTPEHKIFTNRGLIKADNLCYTDSIWTQETDLQKLPFKDISTNFRDAIIYATQHLNVRSQRYTGQFGLQQTGIYQKIATSITKMATLLTTGFRTLSAYPSFSTYPTMPKHLVGLGVKQISSIWRKSDLLQKSGIKVKPVKNGTKNTVKLSADDGKTKNGFLRNAWSAIGNTLRRSPLELSSATGVVRKETFDVAEDSPLVYDLTVKNNHCYLANGLLVSNSDALSYMDIDTQTISTFTDLATPSITSTTPTGLTGSTYNIRYKITATNAVGETEGSAAGTATVDKIRDDWDGTNEFVTLVFPRVTGAERYNIYFGDQAGLEYYFDSIVDPGTGSNVTYIDTGQIAFNTTRLAPVEDSTQGPTTTRCTNIRGQLWMTGDTNDPSKIWFGGNQGGTTALNFTFYQGGGFVSPNEGGKDRPVIVKPFRDGQGNPMAACLSQGTNGNGKRYLLQPSSTTVGDTIITFMAVTEDNGQAGTDSPDGVILQDDALWYPSRDGFKTTTTKAQIQNILSTTNVSDNISDAVNELNTTDMESCVGIASDRRLYWALPFQSATNNQVWVVDLRQRGAWVRPWNLAVDWMVLYADNSDGKTRLLFVMDDKIYEVTEELSTVDAGTAFSTKIGSGAIKFSEDGEQYGSLIDFTFVFLNPQGVVNVSVLAETEDGPVNFVETVDTITNQTIGGHGAYAYGDVGYGGVEYGEPIAVSSNVPRVRKTIEIDEECKYFTWGVNTTAAGVQYELSAIIARFVPVGWIEED